MCIGAATVVFGGALVTGVVTTGDDTTGDGTVGEGTAGWLEAGAYDDTAVPPTAVGFGAVGGGFGLAAAMYMVPHMAARLDDLPRNANGKTDYRRLGRDDDTGPAPEQNPMSRSRS